MSDLPLSVLYVDDEPLLLYVTREYLQNLGFRVDIVESGAEALRMIAAHSYDAIISDYQMPGMDGITLLKEIRRSYPDIPFLLFTGRGREEVVIEAIENGADFYIQKGGKSGPQFTELTHKITIAVQRRRDSRALYESELRFRSLIQNSSDIIRILDSDGIITFDSPSSERILGYPAGSLIGMRAFDFIHPEDQGLVLSDFKDVCHQCNDHIPTEYRIRKADGSYIYVESVALNLIGVPGIDGIVTTTHPVHRLKMAELEIRKVAGDLASAYEELAAGEEDLRKHYCELSEHKLSLEESEAKYRLLADHVHDVIWTTDKRMKLTYISPSVTGLRGLSPDEAMKMTFRESLTHESYQRMIQAHEQWRMILQQGGSIPEKTSMDLEFRCRNGSTVWTEVLVSPIYSYEHAFSGIIGVIRDISKRKQAEDALRIANRQLSLLTSITRHDILNMQSVIYAYLELAEQEPVSPRLGEYLKVIRTATDDIQSQLEFTRVYQDIGSQEPRWFSLIAVLPRSIFPVLLTHTSDLQDIFLYADPMLEKVFFNLLDNSVRHGEHVKEIRVTAFESSGGLTILWEDNGVGVPREEKEVIFDHGFGKNTGFGMFLVREILALTGITITETGIYGKGARFEILVPNGVFRIGTP